MWFWRKLIKTLKDAEEFNIIQARPSSIVIQARKELYQRKNVLILDCLFMLYGSIAVGIAVYSCDCEQKIWKTEI